MTPSSTRLRALALALALSPAAAVALAGQVPAVDAKASAKAKVDKPATAAAMDVTAGEKYKAGAMRRWFLGELHRDLWTTAIRVPFVDIDTFAGGLKPLKLGGGMQTKSLRLGTKDGNEYVFRTVAKDHSFSVPERFKGSVVERISRDQVSALHPAASIVAAPLLEAAGVLHATPVLVIMPRDAPLGEYSKDFAGQLGMIEPYPHKPEKGEGFAGAEKIIDSEELLKKLNEDPEQRVDAPAFLAARLVDMLLGDWDRHPGQWKWARMPGEKHGEWIAIPRDRDMAFGTYEGVVGKVGHIFSPVSSRFSGSSMNVRALTWNSLELDRRLLASLQRPAWDSVAADVTRRISDNVIDSAVATMPREYRWSAPQLARDLKERRSHLPALANDFYALVFDVADIHASDSTEKATITRVSDGIVEVRVQSSKGKTSFARRFDARETKEIRLYLHGGDDSAVVVGHVQRSIPLHIVGGNGTNWMADSSTVGGAHDQARFYNRGTVKGVNYGKDSLFNRQHWEMDYGKLEPPARDRGHALVPNAGIGADRGMGLTPRLGFTRYDYGFESRPYARRWELEAAYAMDVGGWRLTAAADQRRESSSLHFTEFLRISKLQLINYYGLGNATPDSGATSKYFQARQRQILFHPAVAISLGEESDLSFGPKVQYSMTDSTPNRFISATRPYGFGNFGEAGLQLNLHHNLQDRDAQPEQRFIVDLNGEYFPALWDVKSAFETISLSASASLTLPVTTRPRFVFRTGAKKVFGDFPFAEAAFVGGNHTARYMEGERFAGDAALYGSTELRIPVATVQLLLPFDVGVVGLAEGSRVYVKGASPGGWHSVLGGGLWVGVHGDHQRVITITMSNELGHGGIHIRTGLGY